MEGIRPVSHVIESGQTILAIQQHADALRIGIGQHGLAAVVPGRQLDVEPLDAPGLVVAAQSAGGAFAVDGAVGQADADEVVAAQPDLPVVPSAREALSGENLGADGESLGAVGVVCVVVGHGGLSEAVAQRDAFVGRPRIQSEHGAIFQKVISFYSTTYIGGNVHSFWVLFGVSCRTSASEFIFPINVQQVFH